VKLRDLDLSTDVGACKALGRIKAAADEVCPDGGENRELDLWRVHQQCLDQAITEAVQATRSARVAAKRSGGC
jgi:UrcA family protein